jgi:hypothetical protein
MLQYDLPQQPNIKSKWDIYATYLEHKYDIYSELKLGEEHLVQTDSLGYVDLHADYTRVRVLSQRKISKCPRKHSFAP